MSKKMMKRSLALGALMAFVITGQAWAGTTIPVNTSLTLTAGATITDFYLVGEDGSLSGDNITISSSFNDGINAFQVRDGGSATFGGESFTVTGSYNDSKELNAMVINHKGSAVFKAQNVSISTVSSNNGNFTFGLYMNSGGSALFTSNVKDVTVSSVGDNHTAVGMVVRGIKDNVKTEATFNNTGNVNISATSKSVTGLDMTTVNGSSNKPIVTFNNDGNVVITTSVVPVENQGSANNVGVQMTDGAVLKVTSKVDKFEIIQTGVGVTETGDSYSSGNTGILMYNNSITTIDAGTFKIDATVGEVNNATASVEAIQVGEKAQFTVYEETNTILSVSNSCGDAYGILAGIDYDNNIDVDAKVNIKGNVDLTVTGTSAYAVNAINGSSVELGNAGKTVSITATGNGTGAKDEAIAVSANDAGSQIEITADTLTVSATSSNAKHPGSSLQAKDGAVVNVTANKATINGMMYAGAGATLDISGIKELVLTGLTKDSDAAIQVEGGTLKVNNTETGTLAIEGAEAGNTYKVVSGAGEETALWKDANLAYDRTTMVATSNHDTKNKLYTVKYESFNDVTKVTDDIKEQFVEAVGGEEKLAVSNLVAEATGQGAIMEETAPGAKEFLADVSSDVELKPEQKAAVINAAAQLAEAGGNAGTAASVASNVSNVTTGRMSFTGGAAKGGKGVGLLEEGSGAAVWTQYMHGKDEATDMPMDGGATSYESNYDGIVLGVDFKKVGKFQSGVAFNYGEGDSTGFTSAAKTKSDYDFWGIGYYGNIRNEDTNFIFDVNYAKSDSDVTQNNAGASAAIEASPETTTWSAGVKVEKLYQNNNVQIVPYTGLRYMSIDTDEYTSKLGGETLFNYAPERQDIWLLPLGVTIKQEVVNDNGWVVTPKVDLSYVWAFGDTDSNMSVSIPGIASSNDTLGFTVMDDGSFVGLVGIEAAMDDWTFGVSYSYQKGDYAESKKWFVDAKYTF